MDSRVDRRDPVVAMEFSDKHLCLLVPTSPRAIIAPDRYCNASSSPASEDPSNIEKDSLLERRADDLGSSPIFVKLRGFVS